ncbi:hypothetical protein [Streptosporangium sp. NPDC087985]|uniref:hypothetical protein n=1 Tax=Streptosporangium sp. NPDC087985 TaxID=3366196 RepID=UPI00382E5FA6
MPNEIVAIHQVIAQGTERLAKTQSSAVQRAEELVLMLAGKHKISADVHQLASGNALVSVYRGLLVSTDGENFRWTSPEPDHRSRPSRACATEPASAAARIAEHCMLLRNRYADEVLRSPLPADVIPADHVCPV